MSENELDILLQDWATRHELSPDRAEAIRANARPSTPEMPRQWWKAHFQGISQTLRESTDPRPFLTLAQDS